MLSLVVILLILDNVCTKIANISLFYVLFYCFSLIWIKTLKNKSESFKKFVLWLTDFNYSYHIILQLSILTNSTEITNITTLRDDGTIKISI